MQMEALIIILWALIGITFITLILILPVLYCIDAIDWNDVKQIGRWCIITAVFCEVGLHALYSIDKTPQIEYPASEWKLDYKITTINDQSDTTYILKLKAK